MPLNDTLKRYVVHKKRTLHVGPDHDCLRMTLVRFLGKAHRVDNHVLGAFESLGAGLFTQSAGLALSMFSAFEYGKIC